MRAHARWLCTAITATGCSLIVPGNGGLTPDLADGGQHSPDAGRDADVDGGADACEPHTYYADADDDGYGDPDAPTSACAPPAGFVDNADDCDDASTGVAPGLGETCDGVDQDCDGTIDEGLLGPAGDTEVLASANAGPSAVVGIPSGVFVAWADTADRRLRTAFVSTDPATAPTIAMGLLPMRGAQSFPQAVLFESSLVAPQVALVWQETDMIRMQILPADGSAAPSPIVVVDAPGVALPESLSALAIVGDQIAVTWQSAPAVGLMGARMIDPVLARPASAIQSIDLDPGDARGYSAILAWSGLDEPSSIIGIRITAPPFAADLVVFDVVDTTITWRGEEASLATTPALGNLTRAYLAHGPRRPDRLPFVGLWSSSPDWCVGLIEVGAVGPPSVLDCTPLSFPVLGLALRGSVASVSVSRGTSQIAIFEQPLDGSSGGTPVTTVAERFLDVSSADIGMYAAHGGVLFHDEDPSTADQLLRFQRVGCP